MVLGKCPSSPLVSVCRQVTEHPTLRIYPVCKHPKDLLTCGVVRASCSWGAPTLPIRKIPPLAEAATLQSLKHCNSNLTWKCISTRLQNAPGSPTHHHELHRELSALQVGLLSLSVLQENEQKSGKFHRLTISYLVYLWFLSHRTKKEQEIHLSNLFLDWFSVVLHSQIHFLLTGTD